MDKLKRASDDETNRDAKNPQDKTVQHNVDNRYKFNSSLVQNKTESRKAGTAIEHEFWL